ncbi:hypothetical protein DICPUDRAFT_86669 [Dictyostelium purpureum]|uniref:Carboxypeptidase Q n=1 Tax=Dictyostelium purpureum TaxID=5786 RepID=F0ZD62_DICPU|nr:uncharacterized protein DICPUDRAFT_86669 [Dictyostelium purpureum]EGC38122.1 hypothetical protein DICPUDRAFT_86669 [Dictyostelium purpureum]|eukprot:XP_003285336.1 hypothetical protein DICPUDRAFT_86669 [Dictyostelium purpureum]
MSMNSKYQRLEGIEDNLLLPHEVNGNNSNKKETQLLKFKRYIVKKWKILALLFFVVLLVVGVILIPIIVQRYKTSVISHQCEQYGKQIIDKALKGTEAYSTLSTFVTLFPGRLSGTKILENGIDWILGMMGDDGFDLVHSDDVQVTNWVRNNEHAYITEPYYRKMNILGLGGSIAGNVTAPVLVVSSFDELDQVKDQVPGKIVLFNAIFTNYSSTVQYRGGGASAAAKYGGVAALVRSITPYSLGTPHTGVMWYNSAYPKVPTAAITLEDADLIQNLVNLGQNVTINLYMEAETLPMATSRNIFAQINGTEYPDDVVVLGGHVDSWDIAYGAMDDGGGFMVAYEALRLIKALGIKPKRTIRAVGWTNEENGAAGGQDYANRYTNETFFSIESDFGVTTPLGFTVNASSNTIKSLQLIANKILEPIKATSIEFGEVGTDNGFLVENGKPGAQLMTDMSRYFWYHHTAGDAMDKMDSGEMDQCVGAMASMALCIANWAESTIS